MTRTMYSVPDYSTRILPSVKFSVYGIMYDHFRVSQQGTVQHYAVRLGSKFCN